MNRLSYQWSGSASPLMAGVARKKIAFRRVFPNWLKRTAASGFWMCTAALLTAQSISRIPLPNDGQVVKIQSSSLSNEPRLNNLNIFWLNGVVSHFEEQMVSEELAAKISYPVKLISNGSLCQSDDGNCYKEVDYIKAFFNRFGNQLTGRGI